VVNLLPQEQEQVVVEQVEQGVMQIVIKEQVEMVKMLLLFLDQHRNLFILQTEQMLDHQFLVFLLVVEVVEDVLHNPIQIRTEQVDQVVVEMVVHLVEVLLLLDQVLQTLVVVEEQVLVQYLTLEQAQVQVDLVDQVLF
jgi:hypothetical protein